MAKTIRTGAEVHSWTEEFQRVHGRALRILHIGNIANNAFRNAAIQRTYGIEADVVCYDYYHVMGCPEWEQNKINGTYDPFAPDWWQLNVSGPPRPDWFVQGPQVACRSFLRAKFSGSRWAGIRARIRLVEALHSWTKHATCPDMDRTSGRDDLLSKEGLRTTRHLAPEVNSIPGWLLRLLVKLDRMKSPTWRDDFVTVLVAGLSGKTASGEIREWVIKAASAGRVKALARLFSSLPAMASFFLWRSMDPAAFADDNDPSCPQYMAKTDLEAMHRRVFPLVDKETRDKDIAVAESQAAGWADILQHYDIVQGYSLDGIIPLVCAHPHFLAYEHGTIREIPFEDSVRGRLCWLTYRQAARALITNSDVLPAAKRMGLDPTRLILMPHAFDDSALRSFRSKFPGRPDQTDGVPVFFAPARHHWTGGGGSWEKGNDVYLKAAAKLVRAGYDLRLKLVAWGEDVEASKELIQNLGLRTHVEWLPLLDKEALYGLCLSSNCVIDQFSLPALGGVSYDALTLGARVITHLDRAALTQFFGKAPPVLDANDEHACAERMLEVIRDPQDKAGIGVASAEWAKTYHSTERLTALQVEAYAELLSNPGLA